MLNKAIPLIRDLAYSILPAMAMFCGNLFAEEWVPLYLPEIEVIQTGGEIKIDGELSDSGWRDAAHINKLHEHFPGDQIQPPVATEVLVTYDAENLYVAFICRAEPNTIRATYCERDRMALDDNVIIAIDTYGDAAWAYEIGANPYGIQYDALWSRSGEEDDTYDLIFESQGKITETGYQVEFGVPFASLRFPNREQQVWRIDFWRNHPREVRYQMSWAAYDRDEPCWPCQWGTIKGIKGAKSGRGIEFLPTLVAFQSGRLADLDNPSSDFINEDIDGELSLGAKYSITSSITAEGALNPDFSQIESDATQIDVNTTFALFYDERRPFFQEGSDLFSSWISAVYTRSINDPLLAAKLIGRMDRINLAFLAARDEHSPVIIPFEESSAFLLNDKSISTIFRGRRTLGDESHLGTLVTDRRYDNGGSGSLLGLDGTIKFSQSFRMEIQALFSHIAEPNDTALTSGINQIVFDRGRETAAFDGESFWGHGIYASFERQARHWWFDLDYGEMSPTFRADNGFVTSNNYRQLDFSSGFNIRPKSGIITEIEPFMEIARKWNFEKDRKDEWFVAGIFLYLPGQTTLDADYVGSWEKLRGVEFPGIKKFSLEINSNFSQPLQLGMHLGLGRMIARNVAPLPIMGDEIDLHLWGILRPLNRLAIEQQLDYVKSDTANGGGNIFEGYVSRTRIDCQFTRRFSLRFITQYDDFDKMWEFDPLVTYRLNSFTVFYLGSTHDYHDYDGLQGIGLKQFGRQYFMKFQYLLQI